MSRDCVSDKKKKCLFVIRKSKREKKVKIYNHSMHTVYYPLVHRNAILKSNLF